MVTPPSPQVTRIPGYQPSTPNFLEVFLLFEIRILDWEPPLCARCFQCHLEAHFVAILFKLVDRRHRFCEIFKISTKNFHFANFSCRPRISILRDFQNVDQEPPFCEMFKLSTKKPLESSLWGRTLTSFAKVLSTEQWARNRSGI